MSLRGWIRKRLGQPRVKLGDRVEIRTVDPLPRQSQWHVAVVAMTTADQFHAGGNWYLFVNEGKTWRFAR
jgi:hypothetical protein